MAHRQAALDRLDARITAGRRRPNALRREDITGPIEEILPTAEAPPPGVGAPREAFPFSLVAAWGLC